MAANTYTWTRLDNQAPTEYRQISVAGNFNSWGDTDLTQLEKSPHNWVLKNFTIASDDEIKFKANHDWGVNWGRDINLGDEYYGVGTQDAPNMKIPAGTYNSLSIYLTTYENSYANATLGDGSPITISQNAIFPFTIDNLSFSGPEK
jgi:hypothetical protein